MDDRTRELMFSSDNPNFETPDELFEYYREKYGITIDVCATADNAKCENFISPEQDFFKTIWLDTGWMNPPYNKPESPCKKGCKKKKCKKRGFHTDAYVPGQIDFVKRAKYMATEYGTMTICLLPARTDTVLFHKYIWDKNTGKPYEKVSVDFLEGRIKFKGMKHAAPFPSMIVIFHPDH